MALPEAIATTELDAAAMSRQDLFEFDRQGYLLIKNMLTQSEVASLDAAVRSLEADAHARLAAGPAPVPPRNYFGERGYHALVNAGRGAEAAGEYQACVLEDFWNADAAFDVLVAHGPTLAYVNALIQEDPKLNNSQIFLRYPGSTSNLHSGGWQQGNSHGPGSKYRYGHNDRGVDCMMLRVICKCSRSLCVFFEASKKRLHRLRPARHRGAGRLHGAAR